jgi:hypothetical protein
LKKNQVNQDFKMAHGGTRKGAGRKKGEPNKRNAAVRAAGDRAIAQMKDPFEGDGYALLAMVYKVQGRAHSRRRSLRSAG